MLFNSAEYMAFFITVLAVVWASVGLPRLRIWILLLASYYFYAANNHWLILLIILSTQVDYFAGRIIATTDRTAVRKRALILSICTNLGILAAFKYFNFFVGTLVNLTNTIGIQLSWVDLHIVLPVGISFYTFQSMSYTIDVYNKKIPHETSWHKFSFYVAFFPQLVAGPIVRAADFLPQINQKPALTPAQFDRALYFIIRGLVKKIVLADILADYANIAFNNPGTATATVAWLGVYAFSLQIYFDFSGYSDIAIGCSRLIGFNLPDNFLRPYAATSFSDFWRRWHISLSTWLRDYLYIPLGGNRTKKTRTIYRNLMITMLLGGLWHGAAFHFVLWGALHGAFLVLERARNITRIPIGAAPFSLRTALRAFLLFNIITFTWLIFRSATPELLYSLLHALIPTTGPIVITTGIALTATIIALGWLTQLLGEHIDIDRQFLRLPLPLKALTYAAASFFIIMFNAAGPVPFIYFQF